MGPSSPPQPDSRCRTGERGNCLVLFFEELTSARVAVALQKIGILNVWVLEGGLAAWKKVFSL